MSPADICLCVYSKSVFHLNHIALTFELAPKLPPLAFLRKRCHCKRCRPKLQLVCFALKECVHLFFPMMTCVTTIYDFPEIYIVEGNLLSVRSRILKPDDCNREIFVLTFPRGW